MGLAVCCFELCDLGSGLIRAGWRVRFVLLGLVDLSFRL